MGRDARARTGRGGVTDNGVGGRGCLPVGVGAFESRGIFATPPKYEGCSHWVCWVADKHCMSS